MLSIEDTFEVDTFKVLLLLFIELFVLILSVELIPAVFVTNANVFNVEVVTDPMSPFKELMVLTLIVELIVK